MTKKFLLLSATILLAACGKPESENAGNDDNVADREPEIVLPTPDLPYSVSPYGTNLCTDASFSLGFSSSPTLGTEGRIRIHKEDGSVVDEIDMADITGDESQLVNGTTVYNTSFDALKCGNYYRIVRYSPIAVDGNSVVIKPHCAVLEHSTTYYITIDATALSVEGFDGIGEEDGWYFRTSSKTSGPTLTVGPSGCDFLTVQGAINHAYSLGQSAEVTISIEDGVYQEKLYIREKKNLTIKGESRDGVIIRERNAEALANGTGSGVNTRPSAGSVITRHGGRAVILVENCDMLRFENITMENTYGDGSQAEVIYNNDNPGSGRIIFVNCDLVSEQDTFCTKGWGWFYNCRIEGDVDFIWGYPQTILFEDCEIVSCQSSRGYIVQCRNQSSDGLGFVFLNCELTAPSGVSSVYLARSGGSSDYRDDVTYINCTMGSHIVSSGWYTSPAPNPSTANALRGWKEYGSKSASGEALSLTSRAGCSHILTEAEYLGTWASRETILSNAPGGSSWAK